MVRSLVQSIATVIEWQNNAGSHPTIELNIDELERLSLSPRQTNDFSRNVVVNSDKISLDPGRRWHTDIPKVSPDKNLADTERKIEAMYNEFLNQDI